MKERISKAAFIVNIIGFITIILSRFIGLERIENNFALDVIFSILLVVGVVIAPIVQIVMYFKDAEQAGNFMLYSVAASFVCILIMIFPSNNVSLRTFTLLWVYSTLNGAFAVIKNRKKIPKKLFIYGGLVAAAIILYPIVDCVVKTYNSSDVYKYDEQGNLILHNHIKYEYADGRCIKEIDGYRITMFEYNEAGQKVKSIDSKGSERKYIYDEKGLLRKIVYDGGYMEYDYFDDEPDKTSELRLYKDNEEPEFFYVFDKDGNRVIWGVRDSRYKDYYFTMRTHWENGNIKTRRVFKLFSREIK
ncbi:MAG: RHS repeat protein [Treponema sp.]|nr:RHS repeat protein [Treponema sp.]